MDLHLFIFINIFVFFLFLETFVESKTITFHGRGQAGRGTARRDGELRRQSQAAGPGGGAGWGGVERSRQSGAIFDSLGMKSYRPGNIFENMITECVLSKTRLSHGRGEAVRGTTKKAVQRGGAIMKTYSQQCVRCLKPGPEAQRTLTDPANPTDLTNPNDLTDPTDLTNPPNLTDPTNSTNPTDSTDPTDQTKTSRWGTPKRGAARLGGGRAAAERGGA